MRLAELLSIPAAARIPAGKQLGAPAASAFRLLPTVLAKHVRKTLGLRTSSGEK